MDVIAVLLFLPVFLLYFGFFGGFGAAIAEGGREDHSLLQNALVGAMASFVIGAAVPEWRLDDSPLAGPLPTVIGAALIWAVAIRSIPVTGKDLRI